MKKAIIILTILSVGIIAYQEFVNSVPRFSQEMNELICIQECI